jgi:hypothetical protein
MAPYHMKLFQLGIAGVLPRTLDQPDGAYLSTDSFENLGEEL